MRSRRSSSSSFYYPKHDMSLVSSSSSSSSTTSTLAPSQQQQQQLQLEPQEEPAITAPSASTDNNSNNNPIVQLASHLWTSIVHFKDNTVQLYTNHQTCNFIRLQQRQFADKFTLEQRRIPKYIPPLLQPPTKNNNNNNSNYYTRTGISYKDYLFLENGKQDRNKLGKLLFFMVFSPNLVPYLFWFFPNSLPSPFLRPAQSRDTTTGSTTGSEAAASLEAWTRAIQSRVYSVLTTMCELEKGASSTAPISGGFKLLPFVGGGSGGTKAKNESLKLQSIVNRLESEYLPYMSGHTTTTRESLLTWGEHGGSNNPSAAATVQEQVLHDLSSFIYSSPQPLTRADIRLVSIPKPIWSGLRKALFTSSPVSRGGTAAAAAANSGINEIIASLTPNYFTRTRIVEHIQNLQVQDEFLVYEDIDMKSLSREELVEACHDRCIGTVSDVDNVLRGKLRHWLDCMVLQPRSYYQGKSEEGKEYYNSNMARMLLLCTNAVQSTMDEHVCGMLPRLLYQTQSK